jgi:hypothetical protein
VKEKYVSHYWSPSREDIMYHHLTTRRDGIINYFRFPFNSNLRINSQKQTVVEEEISVKPTEFVGTNLCGELG